MADHADIAGETIDICLDDALKRQLGRSRPVQDPRFDGVHCVEDDCGAEIPEGRLATGAVTCITCQTLAEQRVRTRQHNVSVDE